MSSFEKEAATKKNPKWTEFIRRENKLDKREGDTRSEFSRDYNRILHCTGYRRLKHKTQVFFASENDHICTRMEHVNYVAAISHTISKELKLNTALTNAIAIGHDLGHAPFGHEGENILNGLIKKHIHIDDEFWHEKNSLWFVDNLETLANSENKKRNLSLTYAVRDGIVCHCGEDDEESIHPRSNVIDLQKISKSDKTQPFTWEGCVVKIADKIAYIGKDIEDAFRLDMFTPFELYWKIKELKPYLLSRKTDRLEVKRINNTFLIHCFIQDLIHSSKPKSGIRFSEERLELMKGLRELNDKLIYKHPRLNNYKKFAKLVLESIFQELSSCYAGKDTLNVLEVKLKPYTLLKNGFSDWMIKYTNLNPAEREKEWYENEIIYDTDNERNYYRAIIGYISGMTDNYAIAIFNELISFR